MCKDSMESPLPTHTHTNAPNVSKTLEHRRSGSQWGEWKQSGRPEQASVTWISRGIVNEESSVTEKTTPVPGVQLLIDEQQH